MADRLISADKIADYVCDQCGACNCDRNPTYCVERDFIVACAKEMPEAVVRCKECRFHEHEEPGMVWCPNVVGSWIEEDGYCSRGEREEDEKTD